MLNGRSTILVRWGIPLSFVAAIFLVYWPALRAGFVYDDAFYIEKNTNIRQVFPVSRFFFDRSVISSDKAFYGDAYRPIQTLSFALNYATGGLNPFGYHLVNIILHIGNAIVLYYLLLKIFSDRFFASAATLIFAFHPAQVESVVWVASRTNVFFLFFYLGSLLLYVNRKYTLAYAGFALALLSKEMAATLPALVLLYDLYFERKSQALLPWIKERIWRYGVLGVIAVSYLVLRAHVVGSFSPNVYYGGGVYGTVLTMAKVLLIYLRILFLPVHLRVEYIIDRPGLALSLCSALVLLGMVLAAYVSRIKTRMVSFGIIWFLVALIPASNIIRPIPVPMAERFLYLPLIGFAMVVSFALSKVPSKKLSIGILSLLLVFYGHQTFARSSDWRTPVAFWSKEAQLNPNTPKALGGFGASLLGEHRYDEAQEQLLKAVEFDPSYGDAYIGLGDISVHKERYSEAAAYYQKAVVLPAGHSYANAFIGLGNVYFITGDLVHAQQQYERVIAEYPGQGEAEVYINLGNVYATQKKYAKAQEVYQKAIAMDPGSSQVYFNLSYTYFLQGDKSQAIQALEDGIKRIPETGLATTDTQKLESLKKLVQGMK